MVHDRLDERALLRESVEKFVSRSYGVEARTALVNATPGFSTAHWATFAELGWLMICIPEALGGIGAPFADAAILIEAFGSGLLLEPFTPAVMLSGALLAAGAALPAAAALLDATGDGSALVATAYRDGSTPARVSGDGEARRLSGAKTGVLFAASATTFIVTALDERERLTLVLADARLPGVAIEERVAVDGSRSGTVTFSGVQVGDDRVLPLADPADALERALDRADAALCAEAAGVIARAYRDAAAYVRERLQFGRPIASFQVVRHRIADMFVELELARAAAARAAEAIDRDDASRAQTISAAKLQVIASGRFVCDNAVQLHGAIGIAAEAAASHALARINGIAVTFGDVLAHRTRYLATREGPLL